MGLSETDKEDLSTKQSYYFDLGVYPAGQEVEVSLVLRLDTQVLEQCCKKSVNGKQELFCTRATATLEWDNAISQPAALYAGPGLYRYCQPPPSDLYRPTSAVSVSRCACASCCSAVRRSRSVSRTSR